MDTRSYGLSREIADSIQQLVVDAETETEYWKPLVAFAAADNSRFVDLQHLVLDADLPTAAYAGSLLRDPPRARCLYFYDESCLECVARCPVAALDPAVALDKQACWQRCQAVAEEFKHLGPSEVCGKCAIGPCSFGSAV
jgi:hypothetical protein